MITPRDYQTQCVDITLKRILSSTPPRRHYYVLPTGTGKTEVAALLLDKLCDYGVVLFVAHRKELIEQTASRFSHGLLHRAIGVVMADRMELDIVNPLGQEILLNDMLVCSIQTLARGRIEKICEHVANQGKKIVCCFFDECHHVTDSNSYAAIIEKVRAVFPTVSVCGCTATDYRNDEHSMQAVLKECTFYRSVPQMQQAGWLAPISWRCLSVAADMSKLKVGMVDGEKGYTVASMEEAFSPALAEMVEKSLPLIGKRPTCVFAASVLHAQIIADLYEERGVSARAIWGDMPKQDRESYLECWQTGFVQVVVNVGILTEGFDYKPIAPNQEGLAAIVMMRPIMSPGLAMQMYGRGTRLKYGKYVDCLIIDCSGNANLIESSQIILPKLFEMPLSEEVIEKLSNPASVEEVTLSTEQADEPYLHQPLKKRPVVLRVLDPMKRSWLSWGVQSGVYYTDTMQDTFLACVPDQNKTGLYYGVLFTHDRLTYSVKADKLFNHPMRLHLLMQHINKLVAQQGTKNILQKNAAWRASVPSEKQLNMLAGKNPNIYAQAKREGWNKGEVSLAITWEQIKRPLRALGYKQEVLI